jgi:F-type H+-transporting ATPase subunit b
MTRLGSLVTRLKQIPSCFLALLVIVCASAALACAQGQSSQPQVSQGHPAQDQSSMEGQSDKDQRQPEGPARQLVHQSREAAGEEKNETEEFKRSPAVSWVSKVTGLPLTRAYWLCVITNFVVIFVVIVWAARKALPGLFRARTAAIQKAMQEAQKASAEARAKLAEIESRLARLDSEIAAIRDAAEKEGAAEEQRIKAAAEEDARKIVAAAEQEIAAAAKAARRQLTAYAGDLAVSLAQKQIRVDAATDQALVRNFASQLGTSASGTSASGPSASGWSGSGKDQN